MRQMGLLLVSPRASDASPAESEGGASLALGGS